MCIINIYDVRLDGKTTASENKYLMLILQTCFGRSRPQCLSGTILDINEQTQDRKRIQGLHRNPKLPSTSNIKQKSRLKRNNGIQRQYLNFRESFPTKIYIWHLSDVRFKKTH